MIGVWWSGAEPDVTPAGDQSKGYKALMLQHGAGKFDVHADLEKFVVSKGKSVAKDDFAQVLYNRGLINSMIGTEAIRTAHEEVRQQADDRRAGPLGLREPRPDRRAHQGARLRGHAAAAEVLLPGPPGRRRRPRPAVGRQGVEDRSPTTTRPTCRSSTRWSRSAAKYAAEKKITPRDCSKES